MKLSEKMLIVAAWLENANNELLCEAEENEEVLSVVASALTASAEILKGGAEDLKEVEPQSAPEPSKLTPEMLDEIAAMAEKFEADGLVKNASVLDEILYTLSSPKDWVFNMKKAEDAKLDELKKKYHNTKERDDELNKVSDSLKAIKDSKFTENPVINQFGLSQRNCPDHAGAPIARIGENRWQCSLDGKIYDFENGYTDLKGERVPGGSVSNQSATLLDNMPNFQIFDSRNERLGQEQ